MTGVSDWGRFLPLFFVTGVLAQGAPDGLTVVLHEFERCGEGAKVIARQDVDLASDGVITALINKTLADYRAQCSSKWSAMGSFTIRAYYASNQGGFTPDLQFDVDRNGRIQSWQYRTAIDARARQADDARRQQEARAYSLRGQV